MTTSKPAKQFFRRAREASAIVRPEPKAERQPPPTSKARIPVVAAPNAVPASVEERRQPLERHYSVKEAAAELGVSGWQIYDAVAKRQLTVVRFTPKGRIRISRAALDAWLKANEVPAARGPVAPGVKDLPLPRAARSSVENLLPPGWKRPSFA